MNANLASLSSHQLVQEFVRVSLDQYEAHRYRRVAAYNRLYWLTETIEKELKARSGDQRRLLIPLYAHQNIQVRLKSAMATLALDMEGARQVLQAIKDEQRFPFAADAAGMLFALDEGRYVPS